MTSNFQQSMRAALFAALLLEPALFSATPAQGDSKAAIEAKRRSEDYASRLEAENLRREREVSAILGKTNNHEKAVPKNAPASRPRRNSASPIADRRSLVDVSVWACSRVRPDGDSHVLAELEGRQLLLFAKGAYVILDENGLQIDSSGVLPGVRVTTVRDSSIFIVLQLDAAMAIEKTAGMRLIQSKTCIAPLKSIVQSISENAEQIFKSNLEPNPGETKGLILLRKMELRDPSIKYGPRCRYWMDIYAKSN